MDWNHQNIVLVIFCSHPTLDHERILQVEYSPRLSTRVINVIFNLHMTFYYQFNLTLSQIFEPA